MPRLKKYSASERNDESNSYCSINMYKIGDNDENDQKHDY